MLAPSDAETDNGDGSPGDAFATRQRRQDSKSEGEADTQDDVLTFAGLDIDRLAAELRRRLTDEQRRRLAELLTGDRGHR